jgi:hypothetical protein
MGYDISQSKHDRLERNRAAGRLCGGATMAAGGCSIRATVRHTEDFWTHKIGVGASRRTTLTTCTRHAAPVGFEGVNFRVVAVTSY